MRVAAALAIGVALLVSETEAQAQTSLGGAYTVWQGIAFITGSNSASTCTSGGVTTGTNYVVVYRPILSTISQPGPEGLTFSSERTSELFESSSPTKRLQGAGTFDSLTIHSWAYYHANTGTYSLHISPVTPKTQTVTISGTLDNFYDNEGCTARFEAALTLRP